ncbi:Acyl-CoA dehydrogenase [Methylobacterium frigidaeris]|uniref:3-sulfinopropanoyl-CoA desulfinase n=2 Tax=Methylobacterium frigidaeris TaxID=2038277 RepID=A0AA37HIJ3_9HYPH|nr:Acyl-CoA dehydrogenase [Methylobacterium frigidaeris]
MITEEQEMMRQAASQFARTHLTPRAAAREKAGRVEPELIAALAEAGFLGVTVAPEWGGTGADYVAYALVLCEIAAGDGAVSTLVSVHNSPVCAILERFGTDEQRRRLLAPMARGEGIGAFALTEAQAGSDASAIRTRAVRTANGYRIDGAKQFITSGRIGKLAIVFAVTDPAAGKRGISAFAVPTDAPGFTVVRVEDKLGQAASDTASLAFDGLEVPVENRLGKEGDGYRIALSSLETGRIGIAAQSVGMAQAALAYAVEYARTRVAFGRPIFEHQAVSHRLADARTKLEAARQLMLHAARLKSNEQPCLAEASMAKLFASETAEQICSAALQTLGGYGYLADFPLERIYRDVRVCQIYEGTSDIQRMLIARHLA